MDFQRHQRIPDTILGAWFDRPPVQFTRQLPPTHSSGLPALLREDSAFQLNSQLLNEFTDRLRTSYPVHLGRWGAIIEGNMAPIAPGRQYFDRLQLIPMASETNTTSLFSNFGGTSIYYRHVTRPRNSSQQGGLDPRSSPSTFRPFCSQQSI